MMTRDALDRLITELIEEKDLELVEFQIVAGRRQTLRIFIDGPQGVTVGDCGSVSRAIARRLDAEEKMTGEYVLEVSSPGMNRPIHTPEHFRRFAGERVRVELKEPRDGRVNFEGEIESAEGDVVKIGLQDGEVLELTMEQIQAAHLDRDPWKGQRKSQR